MKTFRARIESVFFLYLAIIFIFFSFHIVKASIIDDSDSPVLQSFTSSPSNGSFTSGSVINVYANFDEDLDASSMNITLDTGASISLDNSNSDGCSVSSTQLCGAYVISSGESSSDLNIASINSANITDLDSIPNNSTSYSIPSGQNLGDNSSVAVVDTSAFYLLSANLDLNNDVLTLKYNKSLDPNFVPDVSDFVVNVNGSPANIDSVELTSDVVTLALSSPILSTDDVRIDYVPVASSMQDLNGTPASNLSGEVVKLIRTSTLSNATGGGSNQFNFQTIAGSKLYVIKNNNISVIDIATDAVVGTIAVGGLPVSLLTVGSRVYVNQYSSGRISVIDTTNDSIISTISVGVHPLYSSVAGSKLYVVNQGSSTVSVINTSTNTIIATIPVGSLPFYASTVGTKVYVGAGNNIYVINTATDTVVATIPVGGSVYTSTVVGNKLYVNKPSSNNVSVINTTTDTVVATIPVGEHPYSSTLVGTKLYVNNINNAGYINYDTISVIDTTNDTVIDTIHLARPPFYSVYIGSNLYVSQGGSVISVIDTTNNTVVDLISVNNSNYLSVVGNKLYINDGSDIFILNVPLVHLTSITTSSANGTYNAGQSISITANFGETLDASSKMRILLNTGAEVDLTSVSGSTLSGTYLIGSGETSPDLSVSSISSDPLYTSVSKISSPQNTQNSFDVPIAPELTGDTSRNLGDISNITVGINPVSIAVGTNPYQMVTVGNYTYVANQGSDNVTIFNNSTNAIVANVTVGSQPYGVAYNSTSKEIYIANLKSNSVSVIDADPESNTYNQVKLTITSGIGVEPYYVTSLGTKMYVTNSLSWTVSVIDTSNHTVTNTINVGSNPRGIKAHGTDLYVANFGTSYSGQAQSTVSVINSLNNTVTATINMGSGSRGVAVLDDEVYVTNFNDGTVSVIRTSDNTITDTLSVGSGPRGIVALNGKVYVENFNDGTLSVIDENTHSVSGPYKVGSAPAGMAVSSDGTNLYVSRFTDNVVSIFNVGLNELMEADTVAPILSNILYSSAQSSATISWTTDENSSSTVLYGLTSSYGFASTSDILATSSHSISLIGLTAGTTYHFMVASADSFGNIATSSDQTFTTVSSMDNGVIGDSSTTGGSYASGGDVTIIYNNQTTPNNLQVCVTGAFFNILTGAPCTTSIITSINNNPTHGTITPLLGKILATSDFAGTGIAGFRFITDYSFAAINDDIVKLQVFLNRTGFPVTTQGFGSRGLENKRFGPATQAALAKFQKVYGIKPAAGFLGPITRAKINEILKGLGL